MRRGWRELIVCVCAHAHAFPGFGETITEDLLEKIIEIWNQWIQIWAAGRMGCYLPRGRSQGSSRFRRGLGGDEVESSVLRMQRCFCEAGGVSAADYVVLKFRRRVCTGNTNLGTVRTTLHTLFRLILTIMWGRHDYCHFRDYLRLSLSTLPRFTPT